MAEQAPPYNSGKDEKSSRQQTQAQTLPDTPPPAYSIAVGTTCDAQLQLQDVAIPDSTRQTMVVCMYLSLALGIASHGTELGAILTGSYITYSAVGNWGVFPCGIAICVFGRCSLGLTRRNYDRCHRSGCCGGPMRSSCALRLMRIATIMSLVFIIIDLALAIAAIVVCVGLYQSGQYNVKEHDHNGVISYEYESYLDPVWCLTAHIVVILAAFAVDIVLLVTFKSLGVDGSSPRVADLDANSSTKKEVA